MSDAVSSASAADSARRAAEAQRRAAEQAQQAQQVQQTQQAQQQVQQTQQAPLQQPPQQLAGVERAAATRDVVAEASVDNERRGEPGRDLIAGGAAVEQGSPALPAVDPAKGPAALYARDEAAPAVAADPVEAAAPSTLTSADGEKVDALRGRFAAADARERDPGNVTDVQRERRAALADATGHAAAIADPARRDEFVRAIAPEAGGAAGSLAKNGPGAAMSQLAALGQHGSMDTARYLASHAERTGHFERVVPHAPRGTQVGDALRERRSDVQQRIGSAALDVASAVVPGVDAARKAVNGDLAGAAASLGTDVALAGAGAAVLKVGKPAVAALAGGVALAPTQAEAGRGDLIKRALGKSANGRLDDVVEGRQVVADGGHLRAFEAKVTASLKDGTQVELPLSDPRGKHTVLKTENDSRSALRALEGTKHNNNGQFYGRYNSVEGQGEIARDVLKRMSPAEHRALQNGESVTINLGRGIGVGVEARTKTMREASQVRVMRNPQGASSGFHFVPVP